MRRQAQSGFTLVELAIVLMIIGLLIGGVLRGQELLVNGRVTSTVEQLKAYSAAFHTFTDAYGSFPGDMPNASKRLPGCEANNTNSCQDGDGNSIIGPLNAGNGMWVNEPWQAVDPKIAIENTQFWKHLALAHLITGIDPSASTPAWGKSHPTSKLSSGGFFIRYSNTMVGVITYTGHNLILRKNISGWTEGCTNGFCTISPKLASQLDRKMDDGMAINGSVWSVSSNWAIGCGGPNQGIDGPSGYAESSEDETCDMLFKIP